MSYPPRSTSLGASSDTVPGEEFEFSTAGLGRTTSRGRTVTLHPNQSTNMMFTAPLAASSSRRQRRRTVSNGGVPNESPRDGTRTRAYNRDTFLNEDLDQLGPETEEVNVPDFGHMLGFDAGEDHFAIATHMSSAWKRKLYLLMEEPSSSREAFYVHVAVTGGIFFSAILTTFSTLPSFHTSVVTAKILFGFDTAIVILFTVEYIARSLAHSDSWRQYRRWATSFFAVLDLLSILPYYIQIAQQQDMSILFRFSILRTFRLLRVFRAFRYQSQMLLTIEVMYVAVRRSKDALVAISYFIFLVLVLFSTLIYFAERGTWDATLGTFVDPEGDVSLFDSIPQTAWFALVTMSTTGYGDVTPKTALGKLLSIPLLLFGLLLIALPSFVLGRNFAIVYDAMVTMQQPSQAVSPRDSHEYAHVGVDAGEPTSDEAGMPLLPMSAGRSRGSGSNTPLSAGPTQRMWAGDPTKHTPAHPGGMEAPSARLSSRDARDLTNTKLAKNQYVLLEQIEALRQTVDRQGQMLETLMAALADGQGAPHASPRAKGKERASYDD